MRSLRILTELWNGLGIIYKGIPSLAPSPLRAYPPADIAEVKGF